jgi:uncharacterized membrane protein YozB (DUF420 family)
MSTQIRVGHERSFNLTMAMLISAIVFYGFGHTIDQRVIHPAIPPPSLLYVHIVLSTAWLMLLVVQSALIRAGNVRLHRRLGLWGVTLGVLITIVGLALAIVARKLSIAEQGFTVARLAFLSIPVQSALSFAIPFALAVHWRKRREFHRRAMLLASCTLTQAALARFPGLTGIALAGLPDLPGKDWLPYVGTDMLVGCVMLYDVATTKWAHPVYVYGLQLLVASQVLALYLFVAAPPVWMAFARFCTQ